MTVISTVVIGPDGHGVVRAALSTAFETCIRAELPPAAAGPVHTHFTEKLFGPDCETAAAAFEAWAATVGTVIVTLHDLPGAEASNFHRRAAAYRKVIAACTAIVVSSHHEAGLLTALAGEPRPRAVIPLPIDRLPDPHERPMPSADVGVLGWIYPGKGHREVLDAMPPGTTLAALGRVSPGHDDLLDELRLQGRDRFRCSGFLDDDQLLAELRRVAVPVAAHHAVSASASIGSWLEAGRRPVVLDGPWARELERRCPGSLNLVSPTNLGPALQEALDHPASTWLGKVAVGPGREDVRRALAAFGEDVLA